MAYTLAANGVSGALREAPRVPPDALPRCTWRTRPRQTACARSRRSCLPNPGAAPSLGSSPRSDPKLLGAYHSRVVRVKRSVSLVQLPSLQLSQPHPGQERCETVELPARAPSSRRCGALAGALPRPCNADTACPAASAHKINSPWKLETDPPQSVPPMPAFPSPAECVRNADSEPPRPARRQCRSGDGERLGGEHADSSVGAALAARKRLAPTSALG